MSRIWYTSDLHFNHKFVSGLRGFDSPEEHDQVLIENWNHVIRKDDIVFILGDMAMNWKGVEPKIRELVGRKILITGNHDPMFPGSRDGWKHQARYIGDGMFEAIQAYARRKVGDHEFLMSHFPYKGDHRTVEFPDGQDRYEEYRLRDTGMWLLHGHTHSDQKISEPHVNRMIHVGVDAWALGPITEDEILMMMSQVNAELILNSW